MSLSIPTYVSVYVCLLKLLLLTQTYPLSFPKGTGRSINLNCISKSLTLVSYKYLPKFLIYIFSSLPLDLGYRWTIYCLHLDCGTPYRLSQVSYYSDNGNHCIYLVIKSKVCHRALFQVCLLTSFALFEFFIKGRQYVTLWQIDNFTYLVYIYIVLCMLS